MCARPAPRFASPSIPRSSIEGLLCVADILDVPVYYVLLAAVGLLGAVLGVALPIRERWLVGGAAAVALLYMLSLAGSEIAVVGPIVGGSLLLMWTVGVRFGRLIRRRTCM